MSRRWAAIVASLMGALALVMGGLVLLPGEGGAATAAPQGATLTIEGLESGPIPIDAYSLGLSNPGTIDGGGAGAGKVNFQDVAISRTVDASTPLLFEAAATGKHFPSATITTPDGVVVRLENVLITSQNLGGGGSGNKFVSTESVTLNYGQITITVD